MNWSEEEFKYLSKLNKEKRPLYEMYLEMQRKGYERSYDSLEKKLRLLRLEGKCKPKREEFRIGYWDIEATGLMAPFDLMLSYCIKERDKNKYHVGRVKKEDLLTKGVRDRNLIQQCIDDLNKFDIIVTYYGDRFDWPFTRSRAMKHGLTFPGYNSIKSIDLYWTARSKLKLHSNRLAVVNEFLGIEGKTRVAPAYWEDAVYGEKEALDYIVDHNIKDCSTLEKAHKRLERFMKGNLKSI